MFKTVVLLKIFVETVITFFQDFLVNRKFKRIAFILNGNICDIIIVLTQYTIQFYIHASFIHSFIHSVILMHHCWLKWKKLTPNVWLSVHIHIHIYIYGSLFPSLKKKKKSNCNFLSHNSVFFSSKLWDINLQLRVIKSEFYKKFISCNSEVKVCLSLRFSRCKLAFVRKKSELWDKNSQLHFFNFLFSGGNGLP